MSKLKRFVTLAGAAALISVAVPVWAESAPVFDVESLDSSDVDQGQEMSQASGEEGVSTHAAAPIAENDAPSTSSASENPAPATTFTRVEPEPSTSGSVTSDEAPSSGGAGVSVSTENLSAEERMRRLEQQLSNLQSSESVQHVESLQTEVQSLRGQIEVLNHQIDKMQAEKKAAAERNVSSGVTTAESETTKTRAGIGVVATETPPPASKKPEVKKEQVAKASRAAPASSSQKDQPNVAEEQKIYQTAYDFIKAKKYNEAVNALQDMLKKYPSGQFASNAHYWLGELYGLMGKNDNAFDEFSMVVNKFPGSSRVSDAQLKVGLILAAQSKWPDAKRAFKQVINTYPGTASARLALEQLKQIKTAGH